MKNSGVLPIENLAVYVVLFDVEGNAIGFSKTIVDSIGPDEIVFAPYTWPVDRKGKVISIKVLPVAE
jgi:hypothetical protein